LAEANRGELIDHEEVVARIEKRIQAKQTKS
jgi:predicted transcriptional regulator